MGKRLCMICLFFTQIALANLRDPTYPAISQELPASASVQSGELQAIIISKEQRLAIFNGQTLHIGSEFGGLRVIAITPNAVHLEGPDGKMILFLFNQTIKKLSDQAIREDRR